MKLTIQSNGIIHSANVEPEYFYNNNDEKEYTGKVKSVEIDFEPAARYSDFELWLEDDEGKLVDYKKINLSIRNKMKMSG